MPLPSYTRTVSTFIMFMRDLLIHLLKRLPRCYFDDIPMLRYSAPVLLF
jgi:hypothetical protein